MWDQYEKSIKVWLHLIRNKRIQEPGHITVLTLHHPLTLEASTRPTKQSYKNCTHFYFLPLEILHNIDMWYADLVHYNQLKPVLVRLAQYHLVIRATMAYNPKYTPFDYCNNYYHIKY